MAKTYNKSKHFDLSYFQTKGIAFFDTLDFSEVDNEEIKAIIKCGVPDIEFYECIFKDLDLKNTDFESKTTFSGCQFNGNTIFENCIFLKILHLIGLYLMALPTLIMFAMNKSFHSDKFIPNLLKAVISISVGMKLRPERVIIQIVLICKRLILKPKYPF